MFNNGADRDEFTWPEAVVRFAGTLGWLLAAGLLVASIALLFTGCASNPKPNAGPSGFEKPHFLLFAAPQAAMQPTRVTFVARLKGDIPHRDLDKWVCAEEVWIWGDGTKYTHWSECYVGQQLERKLERAHVFGVGSFRVIVMLNVLDGPTLLAEEIMIRIGPQANAADR